MAVELLYDDVACCGTTLVLHSRADVEVAQMLEEKTTISTAAGASDGSVECSERTKVVDIRLGEEAGGPVVKLEFNLASQ